MVVHVLFDQQIFIVELRCICWFDNLKITHKKRAEI